MARKHSFNVRWRAFTIWQRLGYYPWKKPRETRPVPAKKRSKDFYKGAFNTIPFLNEDAKRTFTHLLLRPGYMIRDYIRGDHERYLAPLTALIIFYAFFALVSAVLKPIQQRDMFSDITEELPLKTERDTTGHDRAQLVFWNIVETVKKGYVFLNLDKYPEEVDTQGESALAAMEATLRSQGIPLFLSEFFFLWLAMCLVLHRLKISRSACAAASAYVLCQFSFFMLFAVLITWGRETTISIFLMLALLVVDYRQWLGLSWKSSFGKAVKTGLWYFIFYGLLLLLISAVVIVIAFFKSNVLSIQG